MPMNVLIVGSKLCCRHQKVQTTGTPEETQPGLGDWTCWSAEASPMCPRGSCVLLCGSGRCLHLRYPEAFCRTMLETLSLLHRWSRGREPCTSAQEKCAAAEFRFLTPVIPLKGVFRRNGWITKRGASS